MIRLSTSKRRYGIETDVEPSNTNTGRAQTLKYWKICRNVLYEVRWNECEKIKFCTPTILYSLYAIKA